MEQLQYQLDLLTAMNEKLNDREKMYRMICDTSSNAYVFLNLKNHNMEVVGDWEHFFNFSLRGEQDFSRIFEFVAEPYITPLREILFLEKENKNYDVLECKHTNNRTWMEFEVSIHYDENKNAAEKMIQIKDITKTKFQRDELEYFAYYDSLTGLFNRNYFVRLINQWLKDAEAENSVVSIMFVDIDNFRKINDGMGLIVGDELIQVLGQYLGEFQREGVLVSHFNSDIFCIAVYDPCGTKTAKHIADTIHRRVEQPFLLTGRNELVITVSIGIAEFPEAGTTALDLINCAEIVMFKAKASGKDSTQYFDAPILSEFLQNVSIEHQLKEAILMKKFTLCFQPQYESKDGRLRGVEALLRWKDQDGMPVSPGVFIPIAEKNGTIIPIGDWVLEESIRTFAQWKKKFDCTLILSINISAIQYKRNDFVSKLMIILKKYEIDPHTIELEITESVLIDDFQDVIEKMHLLREEGIRVSLDDFGTGYSSLSYLKGLPIDTLKIDKTFIDTVTSDNSTRIITESIIEMVKKLGFETVAEGVETQEQFDYLKTVNCDNIQGFLLGKPMTANDIEELLMKER